MKGGNLEEKKEKRRKWKSNTRDNNIRYRKENPTIQQQYAGLKLNRSNASEGRLVLYFQICRLYAQPLNGRKDDVGVRNLVHLQAEHAAAALNSNNVSR